MNENPRTVNNDNAAGPSGGALARRRRQVEARLMIPNPIRPGIVSMVAMSAIWTAAVVFVLSASRFAFAY